MANKPYSSKAAENVKWIARALCRYVSYLHLQLFGGGGLQLGGHGAFQGVSDQCQALAAVVRNGQNLTFHRLPVHPVTLQERKECEGELGCFNIFIEWMDKWMKKQSESPGIHVLGRALLCF